jgi:hypothetical protein
MLEVWRSARPNCRSDSLCHTGGVLYIAAAIACAVTLGYWSRPFDLQARRRLVAACGAVAVLGVCLAALAFTAGGGASLALFYYGAILLSLGMFSCIAVMLAGLCVRTGGPRP